jgi:hypothetical protein
MKTKEIELPLKVSTVNNINGMISRLFVILWDVCALLVKIAIVEFMLVGATWLIGAIIIRSTNPSLILEGFDGMMIVALNPILLIIEIILFIVGVMFVLHEERVIMFRLIDDEVRKI